MRVRNCDGNGFGERGADAAAVGVAVNHRYRRRLGDWQRLAGADAFSVDMPIRVHVAAQQRVGADGQRRAVDVDTVSLAVAVGLCFRDEQRERDGVRGGVVVTSSVGVPRNAIDGRVSQRGRVALCFDVRLCDELRDC